ncbi:hypothetical protein ACTXIX_17110, partial [Glutamicibacter ardleyensis]
MVPAVHGYQPSPAQESTVTALSIVAYSHPFVVGVDTHVRNHVYAIVNASNGALLETRQFPTTGSGINRAIKWVARRTPVCQG